MADWSAPFHMPNFTNDEFDRARKAAIEKEGYKVRFPPLKEIIHVPAYEPMTEDEAIEWKKPEHGNIPPWRQDEFAKMKRDRKAKYDAMLRDPSPDIVRSRAALMASLDDAQDALATIGVVGRLALPLLPRAVAGMFGGPLGWILTGAMLLNFVNGVMRPGISPKKAKRKLGTLTKHNPFTQKGKAGIADALKKRGLHSGNLIEAAQVTDNIWGVGICLGPLMAIPWSVGSGLVRMAMGQEVEWEVPPTDWAHWRKAAGRALHSLPALWGDTPFLSDEEIAGLVVAGHFAQQAFPIQSSPCDGIERLKNVKNLELCAPTPTNILTREVITEAGDDPDDHVEWPATGQKWSNINTLTDLTYPKVQANVHAFYERHKADLLGYYTGIIAGEAGLYAMANLGGSCSVQTSYTFPSRAVLTVLNLNYRLPDNITQRQIDCCGNRMDLLESWGHDPGEKEVLRSALGAASWCRWNYIQHTG